MTDSLYLKLMLAGTTPGFPFPMVAVGRVFTMPIPAMIATGVNP